MDDEDPGRASAAGDGQDRKTSILLVEVADSMGIIPGTTICGLADGAAWPVKNAITKFRGEFEEYIRSGRRSITPAEQLMAVH